MTSAEITKPIKFNEELVCRGQHSVDSDMNLDLMSQSAKRGRSSINMFYLFSRMELRHLTKKNISRIHVMQRRMECWELLLEIPNQTIINRAGVRDAVEAFLQLKWN